MGSVACSIRANIINKLQLSKQMGKINIYDFATTENYGCVTQTVTGAIFVEGDGKVNPFKPFGSKKDLDDYVKTKPDARGKPVYEVIPDEENLRQFAADHGIDVPANVPFVALEKIRDAIRKHFEDSNNLK